jgi:hypothetical protein
LPQPLLVDGEPVFTEEFNRLPPVEPVFTVASSTWRSTYFSVRSAFKTSLVKSKTFPVPWVIVLSGRRSPWPALLKSEKFGNPTWSFIYQIESLGQLPRDFNGYGSEAPNDESIRLASQVVLAAKKIRPTRVLPSAQGGVAVYFVQGSKRGDIECLNTGEIVATMAGGQEDLRIWEIRAGDINKTVGKISDFLER